VRRYLKKKSELEEIDIRKKKDSDKGWCRGKNPERKERRGKKKKHRAVKRAAARGRGKKKKTRAATYVGQKWKK